MVTRMEAPATDELRRQHRHIELALGVLSRLVRAAESGQGLEGDGCRGCLEILRLYADKLHHADEEELLFPILRRRAPAEVIALMDGIEREHVEARKLTATMAELLPEAENGGEQAIRRFAQAARQYTALILQHISKEDHVLFAVADRLATTRDRAKLTREAMTERAATFEGRSRELLEAAIDRACATWGTKRQRRAALRKPTAPKVAGRKRGRPRKVVATA